MAEFLIASAGFVLAMVAGFVVVGMREARDRRVRGDIDLEALTDLPLLAVVPSFRRKRLSGFFERRKSRPPLLGDGAAA